MNEYNYSYPSAGMYPGATPSPNPPSPITQGPPVNPQAPGSAMPGAVEGLHDHHQSPQYQFPFDPAFAQAGTPANTSILGLNFRDQNFWKGALLGAAVTLLVTNETVQKGVMKGVAKIYGAAQGGVQEIKEKFEDMQAEMRQKSQEE